MNRNQQNGRQRDQQRGRPGSKDEKRYFPQYNGHNRHYQSGGYQEEVGNYGNQDEIQGPNRQGRDWRAEQREDFGDNRGDHGGGQRYGQGRGGSPSNRAAPDSGTFRPLQGGAETGERGDTSSSRGMDDHAIDAREISVEVKDGEVTDNLTISGRKGAGSATTGNRRV